ncbi:RNA polymerase sigma factor [Puia dinghuensis]|uniref:DNA-directed RNA polymerase sigma-70 factor n=1 Tax=Puia dinghuensis TaxID=1792502 RepID=A0A8J2U6L8_9BACT|nr:RNA polymerase sigma-70 factor [Puia dinghuensis]GGA82242.1 DNA-directed RNA polymerase sigma-70 factor [Puia dinghuensis]
MFDTRQNIAVKTLPLTNENDLLARVAEGDEKAFGIIFHHYRRKIYSYAFHVSGDAGQADELVQEVFLKVWLHRDKLPHILRFDNWLFTIARNHVFDMLKNMAKEASFRSQIAGLLDPEINPVEDRMLTRENELRLQQALDRLPPRQKLIFTLSRHQGLKHEEIASQLHISRNTVKTHLVQALKNLRGLLHFPTDGLLPGIVVLLTHFFHR